MALQEIEPGMYEFRTVYYNQDDSLTSELTWKNIENYKELKDYIKLTQDHLVEWRDAKGPMKTTWKLYR